MFGLEFLFSWGLLALPLAGLPIVLHLLFRRKSPIVPFSTLRFIKSSLQHTAARRKLQRILLLATRVLLLLLLIWAISQPAKMLTANWFGSGAATAAIVVDTSFSTQLRQDQVALLDRAGDIVESLLHNQLADAQVAILQSSPPPPDQPVRFMRGEEIPAVRLRPQPSPVPLADRVAAAIEMLRRDGAERKWLIVLTDLHGREFPHPLPEFNDGRIILLDLHPDEARNAGVARISLEPEQPIPGIQSQAVVEVAGRAGERRAVTLAMQRPDGTQLWQSSPMMAELDASGRTSVRFPVNFPAERWVVLKASLGADDDMSWDNDRRLLVEIPPRQITAVLESARPTSAQRFARLALDPSEGTSQSWPIQVRRATVMGGDENVVVAPLTDWPDEQQASRMLEHARSGGTVVLMLQPGMEENWMTLAESHRASLLAMLPSEPARVESGTYQALAATMDDPLVRGFVDEKFQLSAINVRRMIGFSPTDPKVTTILSAASTSPTSTGRPRGLLFRRSVGNGIVYTLATTPEQRFTNLATHPVFLPMLVRMSLRAPEQSRAQNIEIGQPVTLPASSADSVTGTILLNPAQEQHQFESLRFPFAFDRKAQRLQYLDTLEPGIYTWQREDGATLAMASVELPSAESDLSYREAREVVPDAPHVLVARNMDELTTRMTALSEPDPRWSWAIAVVLLLICAEALLGSIQRIWNSGNLGLFTPKMPESPTTPAA